MRKSIKPDYPFRQRIPFFRKGGSDLRWYVCCTFADFNAADMMGQGDGKDVPQPLAMVVVADESQPVKGRFLIKMAANLKIWKKPPLITESRLR